MINLNTLLSSFDEKGTLLKWLKNLDSEINNYTIQSMEFLTNQQNKFAFKFTFTNGKVFTSPYFDIIKIELDQLLELLEGSDYISVDENEEGTKVLIELDETNLEKIAPALNSLKLITSGAVYSALVGKQATLSQAQLDACNSGITSAKVNTYDGYASQIAGKQDTLSAGIGIDITNNEISVKASEISYNDLADKPTLTNFATQTDLQQGLATRQPLGDYATTTALNNGLAGKQNTLTAGSGITINNNVISATGGLNPQIIPTSVNNNIINASISNGLYMLNFYDTVYGETGYYYSLNFYFNGTPITLPAYYLDQETEYNMFSAIITSTTIELDYTIFGSKRPTPIGGAVLYKLA